MDPGILRSVRRTDDDGRVTHRLLRAARAGLRLGLVDLARMAGLSVSVVLRLEDGYVDGPASTKLRQALESAGAEFVPVEGTVALRFGHGVCRDKP